MNVLAIGGSDPSSGAGIQSDIRAAPALGANCFSVITAITSQNSARFSSVEAVSANAVAQQLDSVLSDFEIDVINIGMVYDSKIIEKIYSKLMGCKIPIIVDPVIKSTTGGVLLKKSALFAFKKLLIPLSYAITPNIKEAEMLSGVRISGFEGLIRAAKKLSHLGAKNIVITGHAFTKNKISDFVYEGGKHYSVSGKKLGGQTHGGGCNFAIALSYSIAQKKSILESVKFAKEFTYQSIKSAQGLGHGIKIASPRHDKIKTELASAIQEFTNLNCVTSLIPEVQTNFVFAKQNTKSIDDIIGVSGRIVRAGNAAIVAGGLKYGGSYHVGSAVLTIQEKFPQLRSAINVRFDEGFIKKMQKAKYKILSYERAREPKKTRLKENSTISWGIQRAIKNSTTPPDAIYHRGDIGKEPMIILFGENPKDVLAKVKILC
jgi:hydroxymethylpyrimidine/phosphomethylpyrimidine kinase